MQPVFWAVALCFYGDSLFAWGDKSKDEPPTLEQLLEQLEEHTNLEKETRYFSSHLKTDSKFGPVAWLRMMADLMDDTAFSLTFSVGLSYVDPHEKPRVKDRFTGFTLQVDGLRKKFKARDGKGDIQIRDYSSFKYVDCFSPHRNKSLAPLLERIAEAGTVKITLHTSQGEDYGFTLTDEQKKQIGIVWQAFHLMKDETKDYNK